ncbi:MAG: Re/Si-specific NAD(P)(+) transhydrogenase subunit alpha [Candidatus Eisenbacteria bacterium]|nr:Re/Si-specific NAD(P)(+) transhydrogenase subunit alpha [Candidatus Eisenbacteria bacterium]
MKVGVLKESFPGEKRVALIPDAVSRLREAGLAVVLESGAGVEAGFPDEVYRSAEADLKTRQEVLDAADILLQIRTPRANPETGGEETRALRKGQTLIGLADPLTAHDALEELASRGVNLFALELMPRITRAQSMDVLSSMATISGYKAVVRAADAFHRMFPMFMTAAGTVYPARVFVIGAGVAGLQAVATAKRMGAVVHAYDVRPAVKEQVESLGARFVEMELESGDAEDAGGYAKAQGEEFYRKQRELMTKVVAENDVVITTALIPGKKAPVLITGEMVEGMSPGSVIMDLAAERGGNCELTQPDQRVDRHGVLIFGPSNLPAEVAYHASQMYARNVTTFLQHMVKEGELPFDMDDEITKGTLVIRNGEIVHPRVLELMGKTPVSQGRNA